MQIWGFDAVALQEPCPPVNAGHCQVNAKPDGLRRSADWGLRRRHGALWICLEANRGKTIESSHRRAGSAGGQGGLSDGGILDRRVSGGSDPLLDL